MTKPKYRLLAEELLARINSGELKPHTRLPPIRALAKERALNNTTVVHAYKELENQGWAYARVGSGTYVSPPSTQDNERAQPPDDSYINFADNHTEPSLFPATAFAKALAVVLERDKGAAFTEHYPLGYAPLRETLAEGKSPAQVVLLNGTGQGLEMLSDILKPGEKIALGCDARQWAAVLAARGVRLANRESTYTIQNGTCDDFYYDGVNRHAPKENNRRENEIYIKSMAKILMPGLAYMIVPPAIAGRLAETAHTYSAGNELLWRALHFFIISGAFESHCAAMRGVYGKRYRKMIAAARAYLTDYADFEEPGCGLGIWVYPRGIKETETLVQRILRRKVIVSPGLADRPGFRVGFAAVSEERITEGMGIIASVLNAATRMEVR